MQHSCNDPATVQAQHLGHTTREHTSASVLVTVSGGEMLWEQLHAIATPQINMKSTRQELSDIREERLGCWVRRLESPDERTKNSADDMRLLPCEGTWQPNKPTTGMAAAEFQ